MALLCDGCLRCTDSRRQKRPDAARPAEVRHRGANPVAAPAALSAVLLNKPLHSRWKGTDCPRPTAEGSSERCRHVRLERHAHQTPAVSPAVGPQVKRTRRGQWMTRGPLSSGRTWILSCLAFGQGVLGQGVLVARPAASRSSRRSARAADQKQVAEPLDRRNPLALHGGSGRLAAMGGNRNDSLAEGPGADDNGPGAATDGCGGVRRYGRVASVRGWFDRHGLLVASETTDLPRPRHGLHRSSPSPDSFR